MTDLIQVRRENRVMRIEFNRADKKNALTHAMYEKICAAMAEAAEDPEIRAIYFIGSGDSFTAGNDLIDFQASPRFGDEAPVIQFLKALNRAEKPLIAAVNGTAIGIGLTMLLHCDLVFATADAKLSAPFVKLALVPEAASSLLLAKTIGSARARDLLLTGRVITGLEAAGMGLVGRLFDGHDFAAKTFAEAVALAASAPSSVRLTKKLLRGDLDAIEARMAEEGALFAKQLGSPEFMEAAQAFFERRAPQFD